LLGRLLGGEQGALQSIVFVAHTTSSATLSILAATLRLSILLSLQVLHLRGLSRREILKGVLQVSIAHLHGLHCLLLIEAHRHDCLDVVGILMHIRLLLAHISLISA